MANKSTTANTICINTITERDSEKKMLRILKGNKHIFPADQKGKPMFYEVVIKMKDISMKGVLIHRLVNFSVYCKFYLQLKLKLTQWTN